MKKTSRQLLLILVPTFCFTPTLQARPILFNTLPVNGAINLVQIGTLLILLIVLLFAYTQRREKNKLAMQNQMLRTELNDNVICQDQLTEEKDWLIKEIHHRVKNNLQIVMSLLNTQSAYLTSNEAVEAIRNSQHRLFAISLIHQKLYQTESLATIDIPLYIHELLQYLRDEYNAAGKVTFKINAIPLSLDVALAVPLGLIINEAVSNILKYAFPGDAVGEIKVLLETDDQRHYHLQIADNGIGLPPAFDMNDGSSLGTSLMTGLSCQLKGKLEIKNDNGVIVNLAFEKAEKHNYDLSKV